MKCNATLDSILVVTNVETIESRVHYISKSHISSVPQSMSVLDSLNSKQREAAETTEGPVLIIAGAGSGKTRALTIRIAHMIMELGIDPSHILAVTFTNKAATEMKARISELLGGDERSLPLVGTFHSICVRILRKTIHHLGLDSSFVIYDSADQVALMKTLLKEKNLDEKQFHPKAVLGAISNAKNALITPEEYASRAEGTFTQTVSTMYSLYQKMLRQANALDFDDIIMMTVKIFTTFPEILEKYQDQFQYISVDEYQDTNHAQYILISLLAQKYRNVCVIGDDWQSIYSWRGANMRNILEFEKDYPEAKVIKLEQNYRSTKVIVEAANAVVKNNTERTDKTLFSEKENEHKITLLTANSERDEVEKVIDRIDHHMLEKGISLKDFVVLYRTNAQSRNFEEGMIRHGIPYKIIGGVKFYERKEIKDVLAYMKLIQNPKDNVSFSRVINTPSRKIGAKSLEVLSKIAFFRGISNFEAIEEAVQIGDLTPSAKSALISFHGLITEFAENNREYAASGVMKHVVSLTKYDKFLLDGTEEGEERFANVSELVSVAAKYDGLEPGISLATFLEEVALVSDTDQLGDADESVTLMTLHSSKGLEYSYVFMVGLEDGLFPSGRSQLDPRDLEEERRLMYVGMTRAKEKLYLAHATSRLMYGSYSSSPASRFLEEIPEEYMEGFQAKKKLHSMLDTVFAEEVRYVDDESAESFYAPGDVITHTSWGNGTVLAVEGDILTVKFHNVRFGTKRIAANIAPIRKV